MFNDERAILEAELYKLSPTAQEIMKKFFAEFDALKNFPSSDIPSLPHEFWRDIDGYEGLYKVSNYGRIVSLFYNKTLLRKTTVNKYGYERIILTKAGERRTFSVHILVARAFVPNPDDKPEVNHIDGDKLNNHVNNLVWATKCENQQHAWRIGLKKSLHGTTNPKSKLTAEQVRYIRKNYIPRHSEFGGRALAKKFGVHATTIHEVITRKGYKDFL